ncbi:unnamed protein product, partial [Iphiclides podalirius]
MFLDPKANSPLRHASAPTPLHRCVFVALLPPFIFAGDPPVTNDPYTRGGLYFANFNRIRDNRRRSASKTQRSRPAAEVTVLWSITRFLSALGNFTVLFVTQQVFDS